MAHGHLSTEEFFIKLSALLDSNREKGHGSIYLTQKRMTFSTDSASSTPAKVADDPLWDTHPENPLSVIVRASNSKSSKAKDGSRNNIPKTKFSTIVQPDALDGFYARYAETCKAGMSALKKRDRTKRKKDKRKKAKTGGEKKT